MSKILRVSDRINIKVGDVTFTIAPLSQLRKIEISECTKIDKSGNEVFDLIRAQTLLVKYGLKDLRGVFDVDGEEYRLKFDDDVLSDDCITEVFTIKEKEKYITSHFQCLNEYPDKLVDPFTGKKYQGVALELVSKKPKDG
jgi:hypothetical protein